MTFDRVATLLFVAAAILLGPHACNMVLKQSEYEDCLRYQKHHNQGYPMEVPQWCYTEGFLEQEGGENGS